jgi:hypothetical protein
VADSASTRRIRNAWAARDWGAARTWGAFLLARDARRECARWYAEARTHADTLRVDRQGAGQGTRPGPWNCGMLRGAR